MVERSSRTGFVPLVPVPLQAFLRLPGQNSGVTAESDRRAYQDLVLPPSRQAHDDVPVCHSFLWP